MALLTGLRARVAKIRPTGASSDRVLARGVFSVFHDCADSSSGRFTCRDESLSIRVSLQSRSTVIILFFFSFSLPTEVRMVGYGLMFVKGVTHHTSGPEKRRGVESSGGNFRVGYHEVDTRAGGSWNTGRGLSRAWLSRLVLQVSVV
ncbi:unnamed protein product [Tuber melanosporum]|uniref:(Perigord truffle) hypothetical protein n=1 Tax=Tuber melanosporum (strain Mel28) TaxID=656061 RepID=D5GM36_TUBMM|nr:uncharacterized protein GSTUM_00010509001 [Tuber melanosporum]CAZ85579.1 unnamed protein product [Tuber melanosporum]